MIKTLSELCSEYDLFLAENNLPPMSADELLFGHDVTEEQCEFLESFVEAWREAEKEESK
tara:strand:- start:175 stop:354 length:180 start_codon:yes stop_codon:yes gene_type:complete